MLYAGKVESASRDNKERSWRRRQNVSAQSKYRLSFSIEEARNLLYWKYHANKNSPLKPSWGTGLFRYVPLDEGAQILRDAIRIKTGTTDEALAREFFDLYCRLNRLAFENIGEPAGALLR